MNMSFGGQVYHITGCMKTFPAPKAKIEQEVAHFGSSQIFGGGIARKKGRERNTKIGTKFGGHLYLNKTYEKVSSIRGQN